MFVFRERFTFRQMIRIRSIFRDVWREKMTCSEHLKVHKMAVFFFQHQISKISGKHEPQQALRPLTFRTQVYLLCTQVQTGLGKTLLVTPNTTLAKKNWDSREAWRRKSSSMCSIQYDCAQSRAQGKNRVRWLYWALIVCDRARCHTIEQPSNRHDS